MCVIAGIENYSEPKRTKNQFFLSERILVRSDTVMFSRKSPITVCKRGVGKSKALAERVANASCNLLLDLRFNQLNTLIMRQLVFSKGRTKPPSIL